MSSSVKTMLWSDTPGRTSTLNTLFGRFDRIKSRVLSFFVGCSTICTRPMLSIDDFRETVLYTCVCCPSLYRLCLPIPSRKSIEIKIKEVFPRGGVGGGYSHFFFIRRLGPSINCSSQKNIRNFKHPKKYLKF